MLRSLVVCIISFRSFSGCLALSIGSGWLWLAITKRNWRKWRTCRILTEKITSFNRRLVYAANDFIGTGIFPPSTFFGSLCNSLTCQRCGQSSTILRSKQFDWNLNIVEHNQLISDESFDDGFLRLFFIARRESRNMIIIHLFFFAAHTNAHNRGQSEWNYYSPWFIRLLVNRFRCWCLIHSLNWHWLNALLNFVSANLLRLHFWQLIYRLSAKIRRMKIVYVHALDVGSSISQRQQFILFHKERQKILLDKKNKTKMKCRIEIGSMLATNVSIEIISK